MVDLKKLKKNKGVKLYNYAKKLIPGGTQLLSKRPEMFAPNLWPAYYSKAKGSKIWDLFPAMSFLENLNFNSNLKTFDFDFNILNKKIIFYAKI